MAPLFLLIAALLAPDATTPATPTAAATAPQAAARAPVESAVEGSPLPAFFLRTVNEAASGVATFSTQAITGPEASPARPLVLSFVASYCQPCRREVPALAELMTRHPGAVAAVVVIDRDEPGREVMRRWLVDELRLPLPVVVDRYALVARRYGADELPFLVVAGPDGIVRWVSRGLHEDTLARLDARLGELRK